jgi:hypothetical protein
MVSQWLQLSTALEQQSEFTFTVDHQADAERLWLENAGLQE